MANALSDGAGEFDEFLETVNLDSLVTDPAKLANLPRDQLYMIESSNSYHLPPTPQPQGVYGYPSERDSAMELYYPINMEAPPMDPNWQPSSQGIVLDHMAEYPILSGMASAPCPIVGPVSSAIARSNSSSYPISTSQESCDPFTSFLNDQNSMVATDYPRSDLQYNIQSPMHVQTGLVPMHTSVHEPGGTFNAPVTAPSTSAFAYIPANTRASFTYDDVHQLPNQISTTFLGPPGGHQTLEHQRSNSAYMFPTTSTTMTQARQQSLNQHFTCGEPQTLERRWKWDHIEKQQLSTERRQLSKQTGVPEGSLKIIDFVCRDQRPAGASLSAKRPRTEDQKKSKKEVENKGGACMLCRLTRKKCSGERPCGHCITFWARGEESRILTKELCVPALKISGICPFVDGYTRIQDLYADHEFKTIKDDVLSFSFEVVPFLNMVEPLRFRRLVNSHSGAPSPDFAYSYLQSMLRWKTALLRLMPNFQETLLAVESLHQLVTQRRLALLDSLDIRKSEAIYCIIDSYDEAVHLKELGAIDPSAVEALINILEGRLRLLLARKIDCKRVPKEMSQLPADLALLVGLVDSVPGGTACLPPYYRSEPPIFLACVGRGPFPVYPPCLKPSHDLDAGHELHYQSVISDCLCGWAIACFPDGLLRFFNHTHMSFARFIHVTHESESYWLHIVSPRRFSPGKDVFRQAVSCSVMACFRFLNSEVSNDPDLACLSPDLVLIDIFKLSVRIFRDFSDWIEEWDFSHRHLQYLAMRGVPALVHLFIEDRQYYREAIVEAGYFSPRRDSSMGTL